MPTKVPALQLPRYEKEVDRQETSLEGETGKDDSECCGIVVGVGRPEIRAGTPDVCKYQVLVNQEVVKGYDNSDGCVLLDKDVDDESTVVSTNKGQYQWVKDPVAMHPKTFLRSTRGKTT